MLLLSSSDCDGISKLLGMLKESMEAGATVAGENSSALLVRGLMEYPTIVLSWAPHKYEQVFGKEMDTQ